MQFLYSTTRYRYNVSAITIALLQGNDNISQDGCI